MFNNRFLNLIQALEGFHRIKHPEIKDETRSEIKDRKIKILNSLVFSDSDDKKWLSDRIEPKWTKLDERISSIFKEHNELISLLFPTRIEKTTYKANLRDLRNKLSHCSTKVNNEIIIKDYYYKTLIILLSCILKNIGFGQKEIIKILSDSNEYGNFLKSSKLSKKHS